MNILTCKGISKSYSEKDLLNQVELGLEDTDKVGVIGINGTGKSTFLKILAGMEEPDEGTVTMGNHVVVRYLPQNPVIPKDLSVYEYVTAENRTEDNAEYLEGEAKIVLNHLGFQDITVKTGILSGGQRKKAALASVLLSSSDLLLLDEPTNHLSHEMVSWLEDYLKKRRGAFVMVTHDRYFLDRVCNRILELNKGAIYSYHTNFEGFLEAKAAREDMELATYQKHQNILRGELAWMHRGARARSTKQKARIGRFYQLSEEKAPETAGTVELNTVHSRMGKKTMELNDLGKKYDGRYLFRHFTYIFLKNDRIGIIGDNGCGKSTLLKIMTNLVKPDEGYVEIGDTIKIGYFSQENEYLDEKKRVIDYIRDTAEIVQTTEGPQTAAKMLEQFLFDATLQYSLIEKLSGGEKRRLYLLKVLMESPNFLILDEPTNDLDIQTLGILEDYLTRFPGIVVAVSHDRYFLDKTAQRIFAFENGTINQYEGGYSDYAAKRKEWDETAAQPVPNESREKKTWNKGNGRSHAERLRFSYKEQKEYETIEDDIAALEDRLAEIETEMAAFSSDFLRLSALAKEQEEKEQALEEKMERYLYLSDLAEKIEKMR